MINPHPNLPLPAINAAKKVEEALAAAKPEAPFFSWEGLALRILSRLLKGAASEDDVRDLVKGAGGIVGLIKRRVEAGTPARSALDQADYLLDRAHIELGEAKT